MKYSVFIVLLLALPLFFQLTPLQILKLKTFDYFVEQQQASEYFTILNITEEDVRKEGGWPFPRQRLAEIQTELLQKGALGVGWVLSFVDKDRFGGDNDFVLTLKHRHPVVIAAFSYPNEKYPSSAGTVILGDEASGIPLEGYLPNIPAIAAVADEGLVSAQVDLDNLVRRLPLLYKIPEGWSPSFGTQVLKALTGADTYVIKTNEYGLEEIRVRGIAPVKVDSLGRKWISWVKTPETNLSEMEVQNKFVFVGVTAKGIMPQLATPVGLLEPHKIQAALSESILIENSPYIPDWHLGAELLIFGIFVFTIWLLTSFLGVTLGLVSASTIFVSTGALGLYFIKRGVLLDVTWTLIAEFVTAASAFYLNFRKQYKLRQQIKKQFEHYLDPRQVKRLQDNPELLQLGGEKKYCTYLFTDVRGFTNLSETLPPEEVTQIMNRALTIQANAVQANGGMVDKYIGDACMAIFNAPLDLPNHEDAAIKTALQIRHDIKAENLGIAIGIGINSGPAVVGNMGSDSRFDYTAIGSDVNLAARCESSCKAVGADLIIGKKTAVKSSYKLKKLKPVEMKGISQPVQIYTSDL
jgi:adenylate cyclase